MLHGGMIKYDNPHNTSFFKEFTKDLNDGDTVLWIGFARSNENERIVTFERDKALISSGTAKDLVVVNAELETFVEQAASAQAIFVTGGNTNQLQQAVASGVGFLDAIKGKVYAGSSAGAMIASTYKYACTENELQEGLGWLPIRIMVHYGNPEFNSTEETKKEIENIHTDLELILLPECEWVVRNIEL